MSTTAARRAAEVVANTQYIVAIELLAATRALWARQAEGPVTLGEGARAALVEVEACLGGREPAPAPADDIARLVALVRSGKLVTAVERVVGPLAPVLEEGV